MHAILWTRLRNWPRCLVHILETVAAQELYPDFYYLFDIQSTTGKNDWTSSCNFCFLVFLLNQRKIDTYFRTHIVVDVCDFLDVSKFSLSLFFFSFLSWPFWIISFILPVFFPKYKPKRMKCDVHLFSE